MDHKPTRADFLRALEAAHSGAYEAFEKHAFSSPAWREAETRIALQIDLLLSPAFEKAFLTFASTSRAAMKSDAPGLGKSPPAAAKLFAKLSGATP